MDIEISEELNFSIFWVEVTSILKAVAVISMKLWCLHTIYNMSLPCEKCHPTEILRSRITQSTNTSKVRPLLL
jgi:hypothetical protein